MFSMCQSHEALNLKMEFMEKSISKIEKNIDGINIKLDENMNTFNEKFDTIINRFDKEKKESKEEYLSKLEFKPYKIILGIIGTVALTAAVGAWIGNILK